MQGHLNTHANNKPFRCDECDKEFSYKNTLQLHKQSAHSIRPFECEVCQKRFGRKSYLRIHLRTHTKEKPFACPCGRKFSKKWNLSVHKRTCTVFCEINKASDGKDTSAGASGSEKGEPTRAPEEPLNTGSPQVNLGDREVEPQEMSSPAHSLLPSFSNSLLSLPFTSPFLEENEGESHSSHGENPSPNSSLKLSHQTVIEPPTLPESTFTPSIPSAPSEPTSEIAAQGAQRGPFFPGGRTVRSKR